MGDDDISDFTLAGRPRFVPALNKFCKFCIHVDNWISAGIRQGYWRDLQDSWWSLDIGYLDEIVATQNCALCRLVTTAISESFSDLPLVYSSVLGTWSIEKTVGARTIKKEYHPLEGGQRFFRQRVGLSMWGLLNVDDHVDSEMGMSISLSSNAGPEFSLHECAIEIPGQLFVPSIRVIEPDANLVPAKMSRIPTGRQIQPLQADLKGYTTVLPELPGDTRTNLRVNAKQCPAAGKGQPPPENLLVIDVKDLQVVSFPGNARYLALSYVWGRKPFLRLTTSNFDLLKRKRSLSNQRLPQTLEDAIELVRILEERYLWVDALCIVQDDEAFKLKQISQMDRIYLGAALTIVSAGGSEANYGLSGFRPSSRNSKQQIEEVGGVRFVVMSPPLMTLLDGLVWHTRGWTYQEFMLSKRILAFTPGLVFYVCAQQSFAEDHYRPPISSTYVTGVTGQKDKAAGRPGQFDLDKRHNINMRREFRYAHNYHAYKTLVEDLSVRHLTHQEDALKSMAGVLQAMTLSRAEKYICGLPSSMLEWALLWQPTGVLIRRGTPSARNLFPSWSWIGWRGPVKYIDHPGPGGIKPHIQDWQLLTNESKGPQNPKNKSLKNIFQSLRRKRHIDSKPHSLGSAALLPYQPIVASIDPIWKPTMWASWQNSLDLTANRNAWQDPNVSAKRLALHQSAMDAKGALIEWGILRFITAVGVFFVESGPLQAGYRDFPQSSTGSFRIRDCHNTWVGTIHLELSFAKTIGPRCEAEFIALSTTHSSNESTDSPNIGQNTFDTGLLRNLDQQSRSILLVNVMWIRWDGDFASRVAVGQIHIHAWTHANPTLKQISLI